MSQFSRVWNQLGVVCPSSIRFFLTTPLLALLACQTSVGGRGKNECEVGAERCTCHANQTCNEGLVCSSDLCVADSGDGDGDAGGEGGDGDGDGTGDGDGDDSTGGTTGDGDGDTGGTTGDGDGDTGGTTSTGTCGVGSGWVTDEIGTSGPWRGEVYPFHLNSTTLDESYENDSLCVSGTLGASEDDFGMVIFNIAQEFDEMCFPEEPTLAAPGGKGVTLELEKATGPDLRVVIHTNTALTSSYCALVPSGATNPTILWTAFDTDCVTGDGTLYQGQPIVNISVGAFGQNSSEEYDFCVRGISRAD